MADAIRGDGNDVALHDSKEVEMQTLTGPFDAIIVGGCRRRRPSGQPPRVREAKPGASRPRALGVLFRQPLPLADPDPESMGDARAAAEKFTEQTGWHPARVELVAGALVFTQYNFFTRHLMKLIAKHHGRTELDTSRDYDFTDWDAVERFAREFARSPALANA